MSTPAIAIAIVVVLAVTFHPRAAAFGYEDQGWELSAILDTAKVVALEPLRMTVVLKSGRTAQPLVSIDPGNCRAFVAQENQPFMECGTWPLRPWNDELVKGAGTEARTETVLLRGKSNPGDPDGAFLFRRPGKYSLKFQADYGGGLESEVINFTVAEVPTGEGDAAHFFTFPSVSRLASHTFTPDAEEGAKKLSLLTERHPDSRYADHAHYVLGQYFFARANHHSDSRSPDDVWELPETRAWAAERAFVHFQSISGRIERLRLRGLHGQANLLKYFKAVRSTARFRDVYPAYKSSVDALRLLYLDYPVQPVTLSRELRAMEILFVEDERLDRQVTYYFAKLTPLERVFAEVERQTGVPLDLHDKLKSGQIVTAREETKSLREFMAAQLPVSRGLSYWVRRGNGYYLELDALDPPRVAELKQGGSGPRSGEESSPGASWKSAAIPGGQTALRPHQVVGGDLEQRRAVP